MRKFPTGLEKLEVNCVFHSFNKTEIASFMRNTFFYFTQNSSVLCLFVCFLKLIQMWGKIGTGSFGSYTWWIRPPRETAFVSVPELCLSDVDELTCIFGESDLILKPLSNENSDTLGC